MWFTTANNILYGFNGSEAVSWDGTTYTKNPTNVPLGFYGAWFHNFLFVSNSTSFPNRLWWSALGDPTIWPQAISTVAVNAGGSSYKVGDVLTVVQSGGSSGTLQVLTLSGSAVATVAVLSGGTGYSTANGLSTTGGSGSGATINISTVTYANFVDINPGDSDQIMGFSFLQDELLVFKRNTIWAITGFSGSSFSSTTAAAQNTNGRIFGYGTPSPFSIVATGNDVYYFSMLGSAPVIRSLYKTINSITLDGGVISGKINGTLSNIGLSKLSQISSGFDGRYVYWSIPVSGSSTNNKIISLDTWEINTAKDIYPFTTLTGKNASYLATSTIPGYSQVYYTDASATSGLVFKFDTSVYTDNGTAITMTVDTRDYFYDMARKTKWKYLYITYESGTAGTITVGALIDQGSAYTTQGTISLQGNSPPLGNFILGTSTLGGATSSTSRITFARIICHYLNVQFTEATANACIIQKWELFGSVKPLRLN